MITSKKIELVKKLKESCPQSNYKKLGRLGCLLHLSKLERLNFKTYLDLESQIFTVRSFSSFNPRDTFMEVIKHFNEDVISKKLRIETKISSIDVTIITDESVVN